jgi:hypothetical protein
LNTSDPENTYLKERVATVCLVHHVAGDEERRAGLCQPVEQVPEVAAKHGVEADGRLVEHD